MKKVKWLAFLLAGGLLAAGCSGGQAGADSQAAESTAAQTEAGESGGSETAAAPELPADPEAKSQALAGMLVEGDFAGVAAVFSPELQESLNAESLQAGWEQTVASAGAFEEYYGTEQENGGALCHSLLRYQEQDIRVSFTYNDTGLLEGIWISTYNIPDELTANKTLQEVAITIPFTSNGEEYQLDGVLTLPVGVEKPPVAILIQGSGQSDYNETLSGNRPFQDLAWGLAERGIASIRYNKRYYQFPGQAPANLTISDEVLEDAATAIALAGELDSVNGEAIFLIGHSLGGMLAPEIARENPAVRGLVSLAGSPRHLADILYDQNEDVLNRMDSLSEEQKAASLESLRQMVESAKAAADPESSQMLLDVPQSYWASLNAMDTAEAARELTIPMLFLQGTADFQVKMETDFAAWQQVLEGHSNAQFQSYEGLNHLFMPTNGKMDASEYETPGQVDSRVIGDIAAFIQGNAET